MKILIWKVIIINLTIKINLKLHLMHLKNQIGYLKIEIQYNHTDLIIRILIKINQNSKI
jgi:hypothetical protein